jgi:ferredoxin-type protein NapH
LDLVPTRLFFNPEPQNGSNASNIPEEKVFLPLKIPSYMELTRIRKLFLTFVVLVTVMFVSGGITFYNLKVWNLCPFGALQDHLILASQVLLVMILAVVLLTLIIGRVFCGWLCPFGALINLISRFTARKRAFSRWFKYEAMLLFLALAFLLSDPIFCSICPAGSALSFIGEARGSHFPYVRHVILLLTLVATFQFGMVWCTDICPLGGVLSFLGRFSLFRLKPGVNCTGCKKCDEVCEMNIRISENKGIEECNLCWECVEICPYKDIKMSFILSF